jgi:deazaflavin-dependent oxidoreductase (nitroreductase family)
MRIRLRAASTFNSIEFHAAPNYIAGMKFKDGASVVADLTTIGRKSGEPRTVELRFTCLAGNFYASSSRVEGKHWCQNMLRNPAVEITARGEKLSCVAKLVTDESLRRHILALRDSPPQLERVVFEIKPVV